MICTACEYGKASKLPYSSINTNPREDKIIIQEGRLVLRSKSIIISLSVGCACPHLYIYIGVESIIPQTCTVAEKYLFTKKVVIYPERIKCLCWHPNP